jgi:hypothetical protein
LTQLSCQAAVPLRPSEGFGPFNSAFRSNSRQSSCRSRAGPLGGRVFGIRARVRPRVDGGFARFRVGRSACWARRNAIYDHFP